MIRFEREEADDVFIYSDFVRPGVHTVLVYDPVTNNLYHKQVGVELRVPPPKTAGSGTKDSEAAKRREQLLQESTELAMRK